MTTQMNPTDAEIAGKLEGMMCGGYGFWMTAGCLYFGEFRGNTIASQLVPKPENLLALCRAVVERVDGPAKPTGIERIIYALQLWMKRIEQGIPLQQNMQIGGWETRWNRMKKVIEDWKTKGEMPK